MRSYYNILILPRIYPQHPGLVCLDKHILLYFIYSLYFTLYCITLIYRVVQQKKAPQGLVQLKLEKLSDFYDIRDIDSPIIYKSIYLNKIIMNIKYYEISGFSHVTTFMTKTNLSKK